MVQSRITAAGTIMIQAFLRTNFRIYNPNKYPILDYRNN